MGATITITADTDEDPYSAFWANVSEGDIETVEQHFTGSPDWTLSSDPTDIRVFTLFASIEVGGRAPRLYLATDPEMVDAAADAVEQLLARGPDSLS
ncbi:hypothetical protein B5P44_00175 [Mycobacterium sp. CBMA 213]|uniref:Uncharacterized protein n=1 Tax=Mycolicibacterium sp. CBMA 213 TaxID=1968788 RepID=A0A343VR13_9MYCO|nr:MULTISPECIES: hypothetical protein [unclassified Mycolicibacterium]AVN58337.1 hypothetical protein B5P44_p00042 [Mycolicibacterium sp. CBMA 213]MUL61001.1 hypothetical protein [Mycolicibacterium sp. CBMA 335]MUM03238.1 hypothetical protein [Mycolicibacterium sp. CBMA 213]